MAAEGGTSSFLSRLINVDMPDSTRQDTPRNGPTFPPTDSPHSLGTTVNISGGSFMHIEGDFNQHYHRPVSESVGFGPGLKILLDNIAEDSMHESVERQPPPKCHPDTRLKILDEIKTWIKRKEVDSSVFWLYSPAGHGKTAIMQTLAEQLSHPNGEISANFFFGRGKGRREHARYLFTTIAYQLALNVPGLRGHVEQIMRAKPNIPTTAMDFQVRSLLVGTFARLAHAPQTPLTIIIDGLDEASGHFSQVKTLNLIGEILTIHRLPLRFIIASRPEPQICAVFNGDVLSSITCRASLSDDFASLFDIQVYLRDGFAEIYQRKSQSLKGVELPWPSDDIIKHLRRQSSGQFIYAATVLKFVDDQFSLPGRQLDLILSPDPKPKSAFSDLDALYFQILSTYPDYQKLKRFLGYIAVYGPVSAVVLEELLHLDAGEVDTTLQGLHAILTFSPDDFSESGLISITHASFIDFIFDANRSEKYYINISEIKSQIIAADSESYSAVSGVLSPSSQGSVKKYTAMSMLPLFWELISRVPKIVSQPILQRASQIPESRPSIKRRRKKALLIGIVEVIRSEPDILTQPPGLPRKSKKKSVVSRRRKYRNDSHDDIKALRGLLQGV
ncbi:hypothetical protein GALMADRAFT_1242784 [Galerina marginata CBS 339.88]|uniref:Nephrocystin 3-like N-terminal domain-containing protein n=1 Tax=Galerina marginata (strain CBS 339.88) TaxID=685588 RepID=A0A067THX3_GALM3|nr:hypothetical protein GALMADRAFT_1242784 [Galerina marginata CBS 339.88]